MSRPTGFTLLEVIIAMAILAVAMGVLVEVSRLSMRNARHAAFETEAALVAESVLAELEAGTMELVDVTSEWAEAEDQPAEWSYEVHVEPTSSEVLLLIRILVQETEPTDGEPPVTFELVRWFQDPVYLEQILSLAEEAVE